jgi:hypothetical protein
VDEVMVEIEFRIGLPECTRRRFDRALAEAPEDQEAFGDHLPQAHGRNLFAEDEHAADHHQVVRAVHAQPCGVDRGHLFAFGYRSHDRRRKGSGCEGVARVFAFALK